MTFSQNGKGGGNTYDPAMRKSRHQHIDNAIRIILVLE